MYNGSAGDAHAENVRGFMTRHGTWTGALLPMIERVDAGLTLSRRAREFLGSVGASRDPEPASAPALAAAAAQGLPVTPPLRAFEAAFGGMRFTWEHRKVVLGLAALQADDGDLRAAPGDSRVLIGREDEWTDISMSPDGRLWSHGPDRTPWPLASSPSRYLEHLALLAVMRSWCGAPFQVAVPPIGASLAHWLGLVLDDTASDDHLAAWRSDSCWLVQRLQGNPYAVGFANMLCRDMDVAADLLLRARRALPLLRISVTGVEGSVETLVDRHGYASVGRQVPDPESWGREPGAVRFEYLGDGLAYLGRPDTPGVVWLFGSPGAWRFEQVVLAGPSPGDGVVRWGSFDAVGSVSRLYVPVYPSTRGEPHGPA